MTILRSLLEMKSDLTPSVPTSDGILAFGKSLRLFSLERYSRELNGFLSVVDLKRLCSKLHVPLVHLNGVDFVEHTSLLVALSAICLPGQPDFMGPGSFKGDSRPLKRYKGDKSRWTTELSLQTIEDNYLQILANILFNQKLRGLQQDRQAVADLKKGLRKIVLSVSDAQKRFESQAMANLPIEELKPFDPTIYEEIMDNEDNSDYNE